MFELGEAVKVHLDLHAAAGPVLVQLREQTGESSQVGVLDGDEVVYVDRLESAYSLRLFTETGRRVPAHCTSSGKVLLAHLTEPAPRGLPVPRPASPAHPAHDHRPGRAARRARRGAGPRLGRGDQRAGARGGQPRRADPRPARRGGGRGQHRRAGLPLRRRPAPPGRPRPGRGGRGGQPAPRLVAGDRRTGRWPGPAGDRRSPAPGDPPSDPARGGRDRAGRPAAPRRRRADRDRAAVHRRARPRPGHRLRRAAGAAGAGRAAGRLEARRDQPGQAGPGRHRQPGVRVPRRRARGIRPGDRWTSRR